MARCVKRLLFSVLIGGALLGGAQPSLQAADTPAPQAATRALAVIDLSELQLDGAAALVLTFNRALDGQQDFNHWISLTDDSSGKVDGGWELAQNGKVLRFRHPQPARKLTVTVNAGLKAADGTALASPFSQTLTTRDIQPMVGFASRGSLLPLRLAQGLPVLALNVNQIDVDFFRVKNATLADFLAQWNYGNNMSYWESRDLLKNADLVYSGRFDLNPARNTREKMQLPLGDVAALKQPGVYLAVMKQAGTYNYTQPATLFTLSDIGLSLHRFPTQLELFTQSLASGDPLADVSVQLLDEKGQQMATGSSDSEGHLRLAANAKGKLLLATSKGQTSLIDLNRPALDLAEFPIDGPQGYDKQFFIFGPRDLYRPGETVIVNALLRDADGKPLPPQPVKAEVVQPNGEVAQTFVWQPEHGVYQQRFALPASAMTGKWTLRINSGDNQPRSWPFNVEDFLPERMALSLKSNTQPLSPDADVTFAVEGRYLYGAPAAGNELQGQLFLRPAREAVAALPGYQFGDITEELKRSLDDVDEKLDDSGRLQLKVESSWAESHSPLNLILQASLLETGGRPVTRRATQAIWPAPALPGIRPLFNSESVYDYRTDRYNDEPTVPENSLAEFDVVYANAQGEKLAAQDLDVRLIHERRDYFWSFSDSEGWQSRYDEKDLQEEQQRISVAAGGSQKVSFPVEWGTYRLEVHAGDNVVSSVRFQAGYWWQDNTNGTGALRPDQVKLKIDKAAYQPGDTARVTVESPAAGKGYLLVESSSGTLWWQPLDVPAGGATINVPVSAEWKRHDLYLSAIVVRDGDKANGTTPKRAVGLLHLPMATAARRLTLALEAPDRIRPEQTVQVKVKARREGGALPQQVQVLLSAVDSGVLSITDYATPDPWNGFFGRKRYNADQYDVFGQLIEGGGKLAALRFGGDGDDADALSRGGKKPVTEAQIVAQQLQPVTLDASGEGTLELPVPAFNGELRLMAQVWSEDSFGAADRKMVVAAPLVSELATPRFLASGDQSTLALDLTNLTDQPQTLNVAVNTSGLIALNGQIPARVQLAKGARTTLAIPVKAQDGFGEGDVQVTVSGLSLPNETLAPSVRRWKIGVRPAYPAQTLSFDNVMNSGQRWQVMASAFNGLQASTLSGQLSLSSQPPLNIASYISQLYAYPYGCLEQTASGIWPSLFTNHAQLSAMGIKTSSDEARRAAIDTGIARLAGMQRGNGSFGLWSKESSEEFWLTAYVTDFLLRASEAGYSVPEGVINRADQRLLRYLQDPAQIETSWSSDADALRFSVQAYAGLVLARQQQAPLGALRALYDQRAQAKSGLALVQLGVALQQMGDTQRAQLALMQGIALQRQPDMWLGDYGSPLRDRALTLALLTENQLLPEQQGPLLIELAQTLHGQRWFSTQENNALFLAARTLQQHPGEAWQATLQDQPLRSERPLSLGLSAQQLQQGLTVTSDTPSPLYGTLNVVGYPRTAPSPVSNVLSISREYFTLDGKPADLNNLKSGELLVVRLKVGASQRVSDALVVDLLPAGLELENQNLSDSSASLGDSADALKESMMDMQQANIKHLEFRDDRFVAALALDGYTPGTLLYLARAVTPGSYRLPPPQVESMYVPAWRAIGTTPEKVHVR
ncbi:alpha-2-macroglobulin family protein [Pantoea dispersa]|uniref:alpha-2-macroglobulin family protein n=1 Tax=Pantoea dispersa TaxID=59814 RepID=UPI001F52A3E8|nr:alpha-2-macroglobulin [Pantoea dispersa]MCI1028160.1 alpha-2-macroglobulin family protein [Pantoea dispersa]